jgi:hypothetical protein
VNTGAHPCSLGQSTPLPQQRQRAVAERAGARTHGQPAIPIVSQAALASDTASREPATNVRFCRDDDHVPAHAVSGQVPVQQHGTAPGTLGLILVTNYRGWVHRSVRSADDSLDDVVLVSRPLRRLNVGLFGDEASYGNFRVNVVPKIVGSVFILFGGVALVTGVVRLLLQA